MRVGNPLPGRLLCAAIVVLILCLAAAYTPPDSQAFTATGDARPTPGADASPELRKASAPTPPFQVIRHVFGKRYGSEAVRVAICESTANDPTPWPDHGVYARNGQYLGLFQMGRRERARYGHGPGAWAQARAALRYFVASGRDWSPWECKP